MGDYAEFWIKLLGKKPERDSESRLLYDEKLKLLGLLPESISTGEKGATL